MHKKLHFRLQTLLNKIKARSCSEINPEQPVTTWLVSARREVDKKKEKQKQRRAKKRFFCGLYASVQIWIRSHKLLASEACRR